MELLKSEQILFSRYKVLKNEGASGQSFTFSGEDLNSQLDKPWEKEIFIKQYHDIIPNSDEYKELINHYMQLRKRLNNNNYLCLPSLLGIESDSVIAIFPRIHGKSLNDYMEEGITQTQSLRFSLAISNALRIIHKVGIAHLDLKPDNIMIAENGKTGELYVILIDLDASMIDGKTLKKSVIGSPMYMSPEHIDSEKYGLVSEKSDVFTLGILLFELLFKIHPFSGKNYKESITSMNFEIPKTKYNWKIVRRIYDCLNPDPQKRPRSGWVHSTLHTYYFEKFETENEEERWTIEKKDRIINEWENKIESDKDYYAKILIENNNIFKRVYYNDVIIGRNEMKGSGLSNLPTAVIKILIKEKKIENLLEEDIKVNNFLVTRKMNIDLRKENIIETSFGKMIIIMESSLIIKSPD